MMLSLSLYLISYLLASYRTEFILHGASNRDQTHVLDNQALSEHHRTERVGVRLRTDAQDSASAESVGPRRPIRVALVADSPQTAAIERARDHGSCAPFARLSKAPIGVSQPHLVPFGPR